MAALLGTKIGMTQLFVEDGAVERVTVVQAGPCRVTGLRTEERDGYTAVQLGYGDVPERKLTKARLGHLKKSGDAPLRHLREFRGEGEGLEVGQELTVDVFEKGQTVKVAGVSKGKGFQGTVKRHGFSRGPVTHGSHNIRQPGSVGASADPARIFPGQKMPGQMGNKGVTVRNLEIVAVDPEKNELWVRGGVPGGKGSVVKIRKAGE
jgi:large subunit ribosomal protein L3